jgi:hypothetical protein
MTVGIVECQHCGATADLEEISDNEDVCLECGTEIDPDAPVTLPTALAEGNGFGPFCGALGCIDGADVVIDHPKHGERTVCWDCTDDYPVIRHV